MNNRKTAKWCGTELVDMLGTSFQVGDTVVRAITSGRSSNLQIAKVTRIENGKLYLQDSKVPIVYPSRLLIIEGVSCDE